MHFFFKEATTGFEPVIKVLQTYALPLGYVATSHPAPLLLGSRASSQSSPRSADAPLPRKTKHIFNAENVIWRIGDSNPGPTGYEPVALTN